LTDPALVATTIAERFTGRPHVAGLGRAQLGAFLAECRLLLILDNFEQIVAAAPLVTGLLSAAPPPVVPVARPAPPPVRAPGLDRSGDSFALGSTGGGAGSGPVYAAGRGGPARVCPDPRKRRSGGRDLLRVRRTAPGPGDGGGVDPVITPRRLAAPPDVAP